MGSRETQENSNSSFTKLSDSILTRLCHHLSDKSLLAAARACRRVNEAALRVYLARNGVADPAHKCEVYLEGTKQAISFDVLHALNLATFTVLRSIQCLSLIFLNGDLSFGLRDLAGAARLVERLPRLREMSLEFRSSICENNIIMNEIIRKQWNERFADLWMAILKSHSVSSLEIRTKWDFVQGYKLYTPPGSGVSALTLMQDHLGGALRRMSSIPKRASLMFLPSKRFNITSFYLGSPLLFLPSFNQLTLHTLRSSQITSLTLHVQLSVEQWGPVFADLAAAVPDLPGLMIYNLNLEIQPGPLCRFLSRLRRLAKLTIETPSQYSPTGATDSDQPDPVDISIVPRFPHLTHLSVGLNFLVIFFQRPDFLVGVKRLEVTIPMGDLTSPLLLNDLAPIKQYPPKYIALKLNRFNYLDLGVSGAMESCIDFTLGMREQWSGTYGRVEDVTLLNTNFSGGLHYQPALPVFRRWLALFPALKRATWDDFSSDEFPSVLSREKLYQERRFLEEPIQTSGKLGLLDFPDEIIVAIFESLAEELFDLSLVSRRFNFLALPAFLSKQNIWDVSTKRCIIELPSKPQGRDPIAALTIALSLPEIKEIRVTIPMVEHSWHFYPRINYLRRLIPVIQKMTTVDIISYHFEPARGSLLEHHEALQKRWCGLFKELLDTSVSRCASLDIRGSPYLFSEDEAGNRGISEPIVPVSLPPHLNLTSLSFEPTSLLSPLLATWTTSLLRQPTITSIGVYLRMRDYTLLNRLADVLPHGQLRELNLRRMELAPVDHWSLLGGSSMDEGWMRPIIFKLLARSNFSELETLSISPPEINSSIGESSPSPVPHLTRLKSLSAPVPYISHLFKGCAPGSNPLPSLRELEIVVALTETTIPTAEDNIDDLFDRMQRHNFAPAVTLSVIFCEGWGNRSPQWPRHAFDNILGTSQRWCKYIVGVQMSLRPYSVRVPGLEDPDYAAVFRERLSPSRFPKLRKVSFTDYDKKRSESVKEQTARRVVNAVRQVHPQVQMICVDGEEHGDR